jgi:diketogulonate reductase-like aldo/keto reductase
LEILHQSLAALGTDYVDLWLIHHPPEDGAGLETWRRLIEVRDAGLARAIGVSNYSLEGLDELASGSGVVPAVNQIRWNPFLFDRGVWEGHLTRGVVLQGYTPFRRAHLDDPVLVEIAEGHGRSPAQVIVRWHVQHGVIVMPRSARRERILANADVAGFELSSSEMASLDARGGTYRGA